MSESVRFFRYQSLLSTRRAVSAHTLLSTLEISPATFKRDIAKMRDQLGMPIVFDRDRGGYILKTCEANPFPGMWFSPEELLALTTIQQLLVQLQPGLLSETLEPIKERLADLLKRHGLDHKAIVQRLRIVHSGKRIVAPQSLEVSASATMRRLRLRINHYNRETGEWREREISPQRLVLYRDNWYLDAWCHWREALRSFAMDAIQGPKLLEMPALDVNPEEIDDAVYPAYGIFSGKPRAWARLRFSPERARWVAGEQWHPQQEGYTLPDGCYELAVPYADDRDLIGDILRFGPDVQVISPSTLRARVQARLLEAAGRYIDGS